jgi:hypothetical protein
VDGGSLVARMSAFDPFLSLACAYIAYSEDSMRNEVPYTHKGNYVAGFQRDPDGMWRIHWSVIAWQSASKKK